MSESAPFSVGFQAGKSEQSTIDADYLLAHGFDMVETGGFSRRIDDTRILFYSISDSTFHVKKGDNPLIDIAQGNSTDFLEGLWKSMTGENL